MNSVVGIIMLAILALPSFAEAAEETELTQQVAKAIVDFSYDEIPDEVIEFTRYLIADSVAVAVGAHHTQIFKDVEKVLGIDGGDSLILASGRKGSLLEATYLNAFAANVLDFDDSHVEIGHPGATIVPPALVLAEKYGKSDEELIEAIVAGYEFNIRWGRSVFNYPDKFAGPWSLSAMQVFGATVMAAKLMDLTEEEIRRALFFAAANTPLPVYQKIGLYPGQVMSGLKNNYGHTARAGVEAVLIARAGIQAEPTILDGDQGQWRMMAAREFHQEHMLAGIGTTWEVMGMQVKPYAACRWMHSSIDAFRYLLNEIPTGEIERVDVHIYNFGVTALSKPNPSSLLELQFSMPQIFGLLSLGNPLMDLRLKDTRNSSAMTFSRKVSLHLDKEYDRQYTVEGRLPARVIVTLKNGQTLEKEIRSPVGERGNPLSKSAHLLKINTLIDSSPHRKVRRYARRFVPE